MLQRLIPVCLCFILVSSTPVYDNILDDFRLIKTFQEIQSVDIILSKLIEHSKAIQKLTKHQPHETQQSLYSFSKQCSEKNILELENEKKKALENYYNCSIVHIFEDIGSLGFDTAKYVYGTYKDTTLIVADIVACTTSGFNPFTFIYCIFKAVKIIPEEIEDIIEITENFETSLDTLVPSIIHGIESCFNRTTSGYSTFVDGLIENAKMCDNNKNV